MRRDRRALPHRNQLQEHARELDDAVLGAPRVAVARADPESQRLVESAGSIEIVNGEDEVVYPAGHQSSHAHGWNRK